MQYINSKIKRTILFIHLVSQPDYRLRTQSIGRNSRNDYKAIFHHHVKYNLFQLSLGIPH